MAYKPRRDNYQAKPSSDGRAGKIARLKNLSGCRYEFPNGKIGKLEDQGIFVKGVGVIPYEDMSMEELEEVTRQNEAFICTDDIQEVTEEWARADIQRRIAEGEDPFRIKIAKALFRKCFRKPYDKERATLADALFKKTPPKPSKPVVWEEVEAQALPEPALPPEFDEEPPF